MGTILRIPGGAFPPLSPVSSLLQLRPPPSATLFFIFRWLANLFLSFLGKKNKKNRRVSSPSSPGRRRGTWCPPRP